MLLPRAGQAREPGREAGDAPKSDLDLGYHPEKRGESRSSIAGLRDNEFNHGVPPASQFGGPSSPNRAPQGWR
jgi:hypothetical protein